MKHKGDIDLGGNDLNNVGTIGAGIGALNDVNPSAPANGEFLKYDGAEWINDVVAQSDVSGLVSALADINTGLDAKSNHAEFAGVAGGTGNGATFFKDLASGQSLTAGALYYYTAAGWVIADASAAASAIGMLSVCTTTTTGALMVEKGMVNPTGSMSGTVGQPVYLSETAGEVTLTAPTTSGSIVRVVGYYVDSTNDVLFFNPSQDWIELT